MAKVETKTTKKPAVKAAESAAEVLRRRILSRELTAGQMLPGERELSEQLGVSRLTLRSALASLEAQGLIEKVHGRGNRVLDYRERGGVELVAHLLRHAIDGGEMPLAMLGDLLELRRIIAVELLGLVAERSTPAALLELQQHCDAMKAVVDDAGEFMRLDLHFARLLVRAAGNLSLELLYNTVQRIVRENPSFEPAFSVNAKATVMTYEGLLLLLRSRDPERVRAQARALLEPMDKRTMDRLAELAVALETV